MPEKRTSEAPRASECPFARRIIGGLPWLASSPSHYRLAPEATNPGTGLEITYLGSDWCLFLERGGEVSTKLFRQRDHAFDMVATAFARMT